MQKSTYQQHWWNSAKLRNHNIYLIAKYTGLPKDPRQTSKPGYMKDPENVIYDEQLYLTRGLRDQDLKNHVILNLTEQKIVKNSWKTGATFEEAFAHYYEGYADYIDDCVNQLNETIQSK
jgi:hypothetical protein